MIVYNILGEWGPPQSKEMLTYKSDIPKEIQDQLARLGLDMSAEIFRRIEISGQREAMSRDLAAAPSNSSEKERFEQLYLKGFWQMVDTPFGNLSFAQIRGHEKKDEILDDHMTPAQSKAYINWEKWKTQAAIKDGDLVAERKQAAIARVKTEKAWEQAAIKDIISNVPQIVPLYENTIRNGGKLSPEQRKALNYIYTLGEPKDWFAEWKWDGIRSQIIYRDGELYIWSRGEELITDKFPELLILKEHLPEGTVLDGELICFGETKPLSFNVLQRSCVWNVACKKTLTFRIKHEPNF